MQETLRVSREKLGDRHASTLTSTGILALLFKAQGKLAEAEPLFRGTLRVERETLGDRHADTLTSANNLAQLLHAQGKLAEAEPLMRETLRLQRETLGDRHASNLANLLQDQGKLDEAIPLFEEELRGCLAAGDDDGAADSARNLLELLDEHGPVERLSAVAALCAEHGLQLSLKAMLTAGGAAVNCKYGFGPDAAALECSGDIVVADPPLVDQPLVNAHLLHGKLVLMQRGNSNHLDYVPVEERVQRLHEAGAVAVVLANLGNNEGVAGAGTITVVCVSACDGERLASAANVTLTVVHR